MPKYSKFEQNALLANDAVKGTYAWLERQGLSAEVLQGVKAIANHSLELGMALAIYQQEKFKEGLEDELNG